MTTFKSIVPVPAVADVAATARWYQQISDVGFHHFPERQPWEWAGMGRDSAEIMLQRVVNYQKPDLSQLRAGGVCDAYIRVRDGGNLYEQCSRR
jgi:hypothetical protein